MNNTVSIIVALIPILWLIVSLGIWKLPAVTAGVFGLAVSVLCAVAVFGFSLSEAACSVTEGIVLAVFPISWAVIGAVYMYNIVVKTGYMERIRNMLSGFSGDRRVQILILAWAFSGFLEGAAGYGTAVAIPVSILISLGMDPFVAATVALIGNTAPTAFGAIGIPVITLSNLTGLSLASLSSAVAFQLTPLIIVLPFVMIWYSLEEPRFRGITGLVLAAGAVFAAVNYVAALYAGPELPALLGGVVTLGIIVLLSRTRQPRETQSTRRYGREDLVAWSPYIILFVLILAAGSLFPGINVFLKQFSSTMTFDSGTVQGSTTIHWILTPGTLLCIAAVAGGLIQKASARDLLTVFTGTVWKLRLSILTIVSIVALAKVMTYSGMIPVLAGVAASATGMIFPLFSPAVGALGTFLTGSDTSSNVLFAVFQKQTAAGIGADPIWISAANTAGAAAGKMISPQNIAIAAGAAGLYGREGTLFRKLLPVCGLFLLFLGVIVLIPTLFR